MECSSIWVGIRVLKMDLKKEWRWAINLELYNSCVLHIYVKGCRNCKTHMWRDAGVVKLKVNALFYIPFNHPIGRTSTTTKDRWTPTLNTRVSEKYHSKYDHSSNLGDVEKAK